MEWRGKSVVSSMLRHPVAGPLVVHRDHIEGNFFQAPQVHGLEFAVLYAYGVTSALTLMKLLGRSEYEAGSLGENVTLDNFDESQISVGDIFQFGEVCAQAVYPRIPCGKLNFRLQHPEAQKAMQDCGRSGVYFRILQPGKIFRTDEVSCVELAPHRFLISDLYRKMVSGRPLDRAEMELAVANGAFPQKALDKWTALLKD